MITLFILALPVMIILHALNVHDITPLGYTPGGFSFRCVAACGALLLSGHMRACKPRAARYAESQKQYPGIEAEKDIEKSKWER